MIIITVLAFGGIGVGAFALVEDLWVSRDLSIIIVALSAALVGSGIIALILLHQARLARLSEERRLRTGKDTRHLFDYQGVDDSRTGTRARYTPENEEESSACGYCANIFNFCVGAVPDAHVPSTTATVFPESTNTQDARQREGGDMQLTAAVTKYNQDLNVAIYHGDNDAIGRVLDLLEQVAVTVELIRVTGIGRTVNQVVGLHHTRAQALVTRWRTVVTPTRHAPSTRTASRISGSGQSCEIGS